MVLQAITRNCQRWVSCPTVRISSVGDVLARPRVDGKRSTCAFAWLQVRTLCTIQHWDRNVYAEPPVGDQPRSPAVLQILRAGGRESNLRRATSRLPLHPGILQANSWEAVRIVLLNSDCLSLKALGSKGRWGTVEIRCIILLLLRFHKRLMFHMSSTAFRGETWRPLTRHTSKHSCG
jgi:hypothetical protein